MPANIYGKGIKSLAIQVDLKSFDTVYKEVGETGLVNLTVNKEKKGRPALIHNLQKDPVTDQPLHADFHQVDLTKKVTADIPLEFVGEAAAIEKGGVLIQLLNEVEVEALPTDLPDKIEVDVSKLVEVGDSVALKDLSVETKKVKLTEENLETKVVQIEEPAKEKEPEEAPPTEGEEVAEEGEKTEAEVAEGEEGKKEVVPDKEKEGEKQTEADKKEQKSAGEEKKGEKK